jgi:cytochrome c peroxidase
MAVAAKYSLIVFSAVRAGIASTLILCAAACSDDRITVTQLPSAPSAPTPNSGAFDSQPGDQDLSPRLLRRFKPLMVAAEPQPAALINLGRMLYFEPLLSSDAKISCNSCHPLSHYGTTPTAVSVGVNGHRGRRNAPSTLNASLQFAQFWDGRAATVQAQVRGPLLNPDEMGMDERTLISRLTAIAGYKNAFDAAFPGSPHPISVDNAATAIAAFEDGLLTPSRWDRYLAAELNALSSQEKAGAKAFANLGCMVCHEGQLLGGSMFQKVGVMIPWPNQVDRGRGEISHNSADEMTFKVPSLRNVVKTAPYFHDGSVESLNTAIQMMGRHQLGVSLTDVEAAAIAAWMNSLTGTVPDAYVSAPILPIASRP